MITKTETVGNSIGQRFRFIMFKGKKNNEYTIYKLEEN